MTLKVGEKAPDFTLRDQDLKQVKLSDYRGKKVVLAFFPGAFTSVCTKEMCSLRDALHNFNKLDAVVLGVSVNDPFTLKGFAERNMLNFPLLSDYDRKVIEMYDIVHRDFAGLKGYSASKRAVILDREGVVRYLWVSEDPKVEPDYDLIQAELAKIK
ncbi:MAG: peroxiredoxin [Thaumarchaeota archaeon]|nr:peroxiredoxin [Nitrososphaerota archaeon]